MKRRILHQIYHRLFDCYGPQHWWPGDGPFEMMVGAILTQSAAWTNVEKSLSNLKNSRALSPSAIRNLPQEKLAGLIRSCGYFNMKAVKLKALADWFGRSYDDSLEKMMTVDTWVLREELMGVHGVGEETADSILLYAVNKPVFVIDAYTRRILTRLGLSPSKDNYPAFQALFMDNLPADEKLFNEYHALLVRHGKEVCKKSPLCSDCCLRHLCPSASLRAGLSRV